MKSALYLCLSWTLYTACSGQQEYAQNPYLQSGLVSASNLGGQFDLDPLQQPQSFAPPSAPSAPGQFGPSAFAPQPQPPLPASNPLQRQDGPVVACPERNTRYPNPTQCDAYIECKDGIGREKLCPEGLLFNSKAPLGTYPCQYPAEVDCEGRTGLQPPNPTDQCPHQFGMYKLGDENQCGQYLNCANGAGFISDCPEGLAFNEQSVQCDWPDQVANCNAEGYLGFTCPVSGNPAYDLDAVRFYKHPSDCSKYFQCIKGRPRLQMCGGGEAFNEFISACDGVENVTGCGSAPGRPLGTPTLQNRQGLAIPNYNQAGIPNYNSNPFLNNVPNYNQPGFNQPPSPFNPQSEYTPLPAYIQPPPAPTNRPGGFNRPNNGGFNRQGPNFGRGGPQGGGFSRNGNGLNRNGFNQPRGGRNFGPNQGGAGNGFRSPNPAIRRQVPFQSPNVRY
ncbi:hypothetical protein M8J76_009489 [Diaphorina citri]|nr:hypothetical protein M8J76_009489 [Diaphorina citri]